MSPLILIVPTQLQVNMRNYICMTYRGHYVTYLGKYYVSCKVHYIMWTFYIMCIQDSTFKEEIYYIHTYIIIILHTYTYNNLISV